jgi:hypothetical protein
MTRIILAALVALVVSGPVWAGENLSIEEQTYLNDLQEKVTECAIYYRIAAAGIERRGTPEAKTLAGTLANIADRLTDVAFMIGLEIGMVEEAMTLRMNKATEQQFGTINNNFSNIGLLIDRHSDECKAISEGVLD